jgi:hypothetical protein
MSLPVVLMRILYYSFWGGLMWVVAALALIVAIWASTRHDVSVFVSLAIGAVVGMLPMTWLQVRDEPPYALPFAMVIIGLATAVLTPAYVLIWRYLQSHCWGRSRGA